ncbi:alpha-galactosidase [Chitinophaga deserti]|uniref:alpha-galactosidase n=1 Tax=Chitinophaga deserti TaxID=2164099 RepID=UPI0018E51465|nr:alpha-galactosidase [Chitinophaga deserti]
MNRQRVMMTMLVGFAPMSIVAQQLPVLPVKQEMRGDWMLESGKNKAGVYKSGKDIVLTNGLMARTFRVGAGCATVGLENGMTGQQELRAVRPEAELVIDGKTWAIGGLQGQPVQNFLTAAAIDNMTADTTGFRYRGFETGPTQARFPWKRNKAWLTEDLPWPAPGRRITFRYEGPAALKGVALEVVYELYDGMPVMSKWMRLVNNSRQPLRLERFKSEILALVETAPKVDAGSPREYRILGRKESPQKETQTDAPRDYIDRFTQLFVVTDYAMGGDMEAMKDNPGVRWVHDHPEYEKTGIRYYGQYKPARVECTPPFGPDVTLAPGQEWESFRAFEMLRDATDDERRGLAEMRFWRAMAPWTQENPMFMHVRSAETDAVKLAIDQCAEAGFEMVIMTFGSGFNIEQKDAAYLERMKMLGDYARSKGVALGGYSLLASRGGKPENLIISERTGQPATNPQNGAHFGKTPCLSTHWGDEYFRTLKTYFNTTGMNVFENDGAYPGDACASTEHAFHKGYHDSQWTQWERIHAFYKWCRGEGIYLNVPDWFFLSGSSKTAMGYVETNWSLPREFQEVIERQNIYDGTWQKTPSMGWMFVPLTQYHGGGAAATIEPLHEHLGHYERRMANLLGAGVQAIYRGPRLFDTEETKAMVKKMVAFYKSRRAILHSDIVHLRRPDGRDWDGILHVNHRLDTCGFAMLYNPLPEPLTRTIKLPLYYTGLKDVATITVMGAAPRKYMLDSRQNAFVTITIPANGYVWAEVRK